MVNATKQRVLQDHQRCPSRKATRQTCILLDVVSGKIKEVTLELLKMGNTTRHRVWFFKIAADVHLALLQKNRVSSGHHKCPSCKASGNLDVVSEKIIGVALRSIKLRDATNVVSFCRISKEGHLAKP